MSQNGQEIHIEVPLAGSRLKPSAEAPAKIGPTSPLNTQPNLKPPDTAVMNSSGQPTTGNPGRKLSKDGIEVTIGSSG